MGELTLAQIADGCWELKGKINVEITQTCVVSGQPVESKFMIELEERFVDTLSDQTEIDAMEVDVDLLVNGEIPVGESLCQWIGVCVQRSHGQRMSQFFPSLNLMTSKTILLQGFLN